MNHSPAPRHQRFPDEAMPANAEFRVAPAETYDVIVEPQDDQAYTIFAETMDRSGYARGTLAPREGMKAEIPKQRPRPVLSMKEMGMDMGGMNVGGKKTDSKMPGMDMPQTTKDAPKTDDKMDGMNMPTGMDKSEIPGSAPIPHSKDKHGIGNQTVAMMSQARLGEPGTGLACLHGFEAFDDARRQARAGTRNRTAQDRKYGKLYVVVRRQNRKIQKITPKIMIFRNSQKISDICGFRRMIRNSKKTKLTF